MKQTNWKSSTAYIYQKTKVYTFVCRILSSFSYMQLKMCHNNYYASSILCVYLQRITPVVYNVVHSCVYYVYNISCRCIDCLHLKYVHIIIL